MTVIAIFFGVASLIAGLLFALPVIRDDLEAPGQSLVMLVIATFLLTISFLLLVPAAKAADVPCAAPASIIARAEAAGDLQRSRTLDHRLMIKLRQACCRGRKLWVADDPPYDLGLLIERPDGTAVFMPGTGGEVCESDAQVLSAEHATRFRIILKSLTGDVVKVAAFKPRTRKPRKR